MHIRQKIDAAHDYKEKLKLMINGHILERAGLADSNCQALYNKIHKIYFLQYENFFEDFYISEPWHLKILSNEINLEIIFEEIDTIYIHTALFAAWAGNIELLNLIKNHKPELLYKKDEEGLNISTYAIFSENVHILDWVKEFDEKLFEDMRLDKNINTACAACIGYLEGLKWLYNYNKKIYLKTRDDRDSFNTHQEIKGKLDRNKILKEINKVWEMMFPVLLGVNQEAS